MATVFQHNIFEEFDLRFWQGGLLNKLIPNKL